MAGIFIELVASWLLLWLVCKKHLSALGLKPTQSRLLHFGAGLVLAGGCCATYQWLTTAFIANHWTVNRQVNATMVLNSTRWVLVSVLYEELLFRGALLYIAIKKIGLVKACVLSAVCFGIYHWFTFNAFGSPVQMVMIFLLTAIIGLSWAYAFAKTGSMYLPTGLHVGWNWVFLVLFSNGHIGPSLFVRANNNYPQGALSLSLFLFQALALPILTLWYINSLSLSREKHPCQN